MLSHKEKYDEKIGILQKICHKCKNQSCAKLPEMARKLVEKKFWTFQPPPPKKFGGRTKKKLSKMKKSQSCSKLPEMARNLVEKIFGFFKAPQKKIVYPKNNFVT